MAAKTTAAARAQHVAGITTTVVAGAIMDITMDLMAAIQNTKMPAAIAENHLAARKKHTTAALHIATIPMHAFATTKIAAAGLTCM